MMDRNINILLVDDDEIDRESVHRYVRRSKLPYDLENAASKVEALEILEKKNFDVVLLDYDLQTATGLEILPHVGNTPVIFVTGGGSEEIAIQAMRQGAYDYLIKDPDYNYLKVLPVTIRNVIEHKEAEKALKESEERFRALTEKADDLVMILSHEALYTYVSPSIRQFGYLPEDVLGKNPQDFIHPDDIVLLEESLELSLRSPYDAVKINDVRMRRKNGTWALLEGIFTCMFDQPGVQGIVFNGRDITDRKMAEEALRKAHDQLELRVEERTRELKHANEKLKREILERKKSEDALRKSEERLNKFMNSATEAFFLLDSNLEFIDANQRGLEILRLRDKKYELLGKHLTDILGDARESGRYARYREVLRTGQPYTIEDYVLQPKYNVLRGILKAFKVGDGLGIILIDTTRSKILEEQLRHAQKMEALGSLAGGIAHDFNNILGIIVGYTELTFDDIEEECRAWNNLEQVLAAANRGKEMVKQIMVFSRKNQKKQEVVNLSLLVREVLELLKSTLPPGIEIRPNICQKANPIQADSTQMHQVIMNICTNAVHAMMEHGGVLEISLKEIDIDPSDGNRRDLEKGRYIDLKITDTGHGMTSEIKQRIFEPYFTTKKHGEGSGMGLAVALGIVKNHGGDITVSSRPHEGTTFNVFLPSLNDWTNLENEKINEYETAGINQHNTQTSPMERILFVYEECAAVKKVKQLLESLGYQAAIENSSIKALELFRGAPGEFDLLVADQAMADMTGDRLASEIKCLRSDIPVILYVDINAIIDEDDLKSKGVNTLLRKPILLRDLAAVIREVLDEKNNC